jgi:hypothetical protein
MKMNKIVHTFCPDSSCAYYRHNDSIYNEVIEAGDIGSSKTFFNFGLVE